MATDSTSRSSAQDLFQRKATGLLRGWSVWDGFIYAAFSINLVTLGLYAFSFAPFIPGGSLILAVILAGLYLIFQTVTYASLIAMMPRAGGDYIWTSPKSYVLLCTVPSENSLICRIFIYIDS